VAGVGCLHDAGGRRKRDVMVRVVADRLGERLDAQVRARADVPQLVPAEATNGLVHALRSILPYPQQR
jgi:hypothetical protein